MWSPIRAVVLESTFAAVSYTHLNFSNGKEMVFYELDHLEELPSIIQSLQENPVRSEKIAENGKRVAQKQHTWMQRVIQMAEPVSYTHLRQYSYLQTHQSYPAWQMQASQKKVFS